MKEAEIRDWGHRISEAMEEYFGELDASEREFLRGEIQEPYMNPFAGIGRNDQCPCGSGKKFKKCCGRGV